MTLELINLFYVASAALFIFGLKQLSSPATAVRGNMLSSFAMLIAIVATLTVTIFCPGNGSSYLSLIHI